MSYFIYRNEKREGAFSMEELQKLKLFPDDLVWIDNDWKSADTIDELRNHLIVRPPLTPNELKIKKIKFLIQKTIYKAMALYIAISLFLGWLISITAIEGYENRSAVSDKYAIYLTSAEQQNHSLIYIHNIFSMLLWMLPLALGIYITYIYYYSNKKATLKNISPLTEENENKSLTLGEDRRNEDNFFYNIYVILIICIVFITLSILVSIGIISY